MSPCYNPGAASGSASGSGNFGDFIDLSSDCSSDSGSGCDIHSDQISKQQTFESLPFSCIMCMCEVHTVTSRSVVEKCISLCTHCLQFRADLLEWCSSSMARSFLPAFTLNSTNASTAIAGPSCHSHLSFVDHGQSTLGFSGYQVNPQQGPHQQCGTAGLHNHCAPVIMPLTSLLI